MNTSRTRSLIAIPAIALTLAGQSVRSEIVYDNSTIDAATRFNPGSLQVGDEVILAGTARQVTNFTFEYYGLSFSGDEQAIVRFYANDGASTPSGDLMPGTVLWNSGLFPIAATSRATMVFDLAAANVVVPDSFTWSVQFSLGLNDSGDEEAGVDIYSPPSVGNNYVDYWERSGGSWVLKTNGVVNMDFAARISAVPEPSAFALAAVAGLGALLAIKRRKA